MLGKTKLPNDLIDTLISMPLYSICKDGLDDLKAKSEEYRLSMEKWLNINTVSTGKLAHLGLWRDYLEGQ